MLTPFGKWLFAFLFFNVLGYALFISQGHFHQRGILAVFFVGMIFIMSVYCKAGKSLDENKWLTILAAFTLCFFSFLVAQSACMIYADQTLKAFKIFKLVNMLNLGLALLIFTLMFTSEKQRNVSYWLRWLSSAMIILFFSNRILVLLASAHPHIDVFVALNKASEALFAGQNPYTIQYEDLYEGANGQPNLGYQPGLVLPLVPFWALFHDIRATYIVSDVIVVTLLFKMARHLQVRGALTYLFPLLWLSFPVSYFVLEQAWTDLLLVAFTAGVLYAILLKRWGVAGILSGFLSASKFYPVLVPMVCSVYIYREVGLRPAVVFLGSCFCIALLLFTPFLLNDAASLIYNTFSFFVSMAPRPDSFSIYALGFKKPAFLLPGWFDGLATLVTVGITTFAMLKTKNNRFLYLIAAMAASYFIFFMFAKQSFCNYYYFMAFFVLLVLMIQAKKAEQKRAPTRGAPTFILQY